MAFTKNVRYFSTANAIRKQTYILGAARTPIGNFLGVFSKLSAVELGAIAARAAIERANIDKSLIEHTYFGNVLQAGIGQAPARQVTLKAGLGDHVEATTINKVCASGLKTVTLADSLIRAGDVDLILAGGTESMSNAPYYVKRGLKYGTSPLLDSIEYDGLTDPYNKVAMGICCENTNEREKITREDQDQFAIESYTRALETQKNGGFKEEIVPITVSGRKGSMTIYEDEAPGSVKFDSIPKLKPAFKKNGSVTAANSSSINDGASALVIASGERAKELGANVIGKIIAHADAATAPIDFTIAPSLGIPKALAKAGLSIDDIARFELNEAFAGVSIANIRRLGLDPKKVNVKGGAVALGHPIGSSGARILVTLLYNLKEGEYGVASICNGGGAATSIVVQKVSNVD